MKRLKKIIIAAFIILFIGHDFLLPADKWPHSLDDIIFNQKGSEFKIQDFFENNTIRYFFNLGYNGKRDDYSPIKKEFKEKIIDKLEINLTEIIKSVCNQLDTCETLSDLFGEQVQENLNSLPKILSFNTNLNSGGTITDERIIIKYDYLKNFIFNAGKQCREIENGQRKAIDLSPNDFNKDKNGDTKGDTIQKVIGHEMIHYLTGLNGGGMLSECIVHCLTKKCLDPDHDLRSYTYNRGLGQDPLPLECDKLSDEQLENAGVDSKMGKGKCFCDTDWTKKIKRAESEGCETPPDDLNRADNADDNFSYYDGTYATSTGSGAVSLMNLLASLNVFPLSSSSGQSFTSYSYYPDILIYDKFNYPDLPGLLNYYNDFNNIHDYVHDNFSNNHRLLIIPSGELMGDEDSEIIKEAFKQFVESGGTLLVLSQQYGAQVENLVPVPEGESLKSYGWRQDQSCYNGSIYFEAMHPALTSSTNQTLSAMVDGYFSCIPSTSTTLLYKTRNRESAMLYYPNCNGTVILTSLYTDWAYSHSQASTAELKAIRDLITFAKNPHLAIPMYDLAQSPTPSINLNVEIKNITQTETPASRVKLVIYTPDRKTVLYRTESNVNLYMGESTIIPIQFTLPELQTKDFGICHVDYELYDAENNLIQLSTESDSGRFSIYKIITQVTIKEGIYQWLTIKDENVYWGQDAEFTMHLKNMTDEPKSLTINNPFFDFGHGWIGDTFPSFTVKLSPGEQYDHMVLLPTTQFPTYLKGSLTVRIQYYDANNILKQIGAPKVIFLMGAMTESTLKLNGKQNINQSFNPGSALNYEISSHYLPNITGNSTLKLSLEKQIHEGTAIPQSAEYSEIKTIYETTHDFLTNGNFYYSGVYTPQSIHPGGWYRLKLEVTAPNGLKETNRYNYFYYFQSNFNVGLGPINQEGKSFKYLIPGASLYHPY